MKGCQSPEAWEKTLRNHVTFRKNYPGLLAVHGPFVGIEYMHIDYLLRKAVSQRMDLTFQAVIELNASRLILHTGFKQEVLMFDFLDKWVEDTAVFWRKEISRYAEQGITVVMENIVESDPTVLIELHDRVDHDHFKLCLDAVMLISFQNCRLLPGSKKWALGWFFCTFTTIWVDWTNISLWEREISNSMLFLKRCTNWFPM